MPKPKKIVNDPERSVSDFIEGLLLQYPVQLRKLQNHNVMLQSPDTAEGQPVALISGGGSGHEPSHAGWIGNGMLKAAVCGGIFASPSIASILAAIRAVVATLKSSSVLLVVKNYTGDRLNFGMAAEQASQEGIHCDMVVVSDDCALPRTKGITGARGVAGTVFVHKVAGAAAAAGLPLEEVKKFAQLANHRMGSLGIALESVTVPGAEEVNARLDENTIEIGLGIHGEAGMRQSRVLSADEMAEEMVSTIQNYGRLESDGSVVPHFQPGDEVVVLVNNLGGTSNFEMSIITKAILSLLESEAYGTKVSRVFVGSYMTSFSMHGVSLTVLNVQGQPQMVGFLDAASSAPAWAGCDIWNGTATRPSLVEIPDIISADTKNALSNKQLPSVEIKDFSTIAETMIRAAASQLSQSEPLLTKYDTVVGDGDCGITMKRGASAVIERLNDKRITTDHPVQFFVSIADTISESMGGTSGVLLELFFRKIASALRRSSGGKIDSLALCQAVQAGVDAVSLYGGAQLGSRTMLDALIPCAKALCETQNLSEAAKQARNGADGTAALTEASAGRSNYLSKETLVGTPDPGAVAVAVVFEAMVSTI